MTLAVRIDGVVFIGGVRCESCGTDRYFDTLRKRCAWCKTPSGYKPQGLRVSAQASQTASGEGSDA